MEQPTAICPACGAPLKYTSEDETIRCGYCDADLKIVRDNDQVTFEIISQPEPQKEVLSHPVITMEGLAESPAEETPAFFTEPQRSEPFTPAEPIPTPPVFTNAGEVGEGAQVYPPAQPPAARSGTPTWVWITLGVVGVVCLLCACLAIAAVVLFNVSGTTSF